jgi:tyrosinase
MKLVMRQNQSTLNPNQKKRFVDAVLALKAEQIGNTPPTNTYDKYVKMHDDYFAGLHKGPAFFAWHREFLRRFEADLQRIMNDPTLGLPYWDWSVNQGAPSWPFTEEFLGGNGTYDPNFPGKVLNGPFAYDGPNNWTLNILPQDDPDNRYPYLRRQFGNDSDATTLPTPDDVQTTLSATPYDVAPWNETSWNEESPSQSGFRNLAEGYIPPKYNRDTYIPRMHNRVHAYVGGSMGPPTSPNDPVFFLHHSFVDKQWADWQYPMHPDQEPYLPTEGAAKGQNRDDPMPPWNQPTDTVRPADVLDHRALGYRFDVEDYLQAGEELYPNQWIWSAKRNFVLWYGGSNGLLRLIRVKDQKTLWSSSQEVAPVGRCIMREDGNLVIYHTDVGPDDRNPIWQSGTANNPGSYLWVHEKGEKDKEEGSVWICRPGKSVPFWWEPKG